MPPTSADEDRPISDSLFRSLLDGASDGLFVIDPETGRILAANRTVCEWLGYTQAEVRQLTIFDCQTTFTEPSDWQSFVQRVRDEDGVQIENEIKTRNGSRIPVTGRISVVSVDGAEYVVAIPRTDPARDG